MPLPLLGAHVSAAGGLSRAVERAEALGAEAMQIFTRNPLQWEGRTPSEPEIEAFRRALLGSGIKRVVAHASYLINLADGGAAQNRSAGAVVREIELCYRLGIDSLVLHPGSSKGAPLNEALSSLAEILGKILERTDEYDVKILLETMAGQGYSVGSSLEELERVLSAAGWNPRLGICADLCHVFGAGIDVRTEGGYVKLTASLERRFGLDRVGCWHISDSAGHLGSRTDRHEHIGEGEIGVTPFGMLVSDERFGGTPVILETPKNGIGDEGNLALLRKLRGRA